MEISQLVGLYKDWLTSACWSGAADIAEGEQCPIAFAPRVQVHAQLTTQDIWLAQAYCQGEFMTRENYCKEQTIRAWMWASLQTIWAISGTTSVRQQQAADACSKLAILCTTVELWRQNLHQSHTSDATEPSVAPPPEWWDCTMYCAAKAADAKMCQGQTAVAAAHKTAKKSWKVVTAAIFTPFSHSNRRFTHKKVTKAVY